MAELIKSSGRKKKVSPKNLVHFTLEELQKYVGGKIQIVETKGNQLMVINEEGKLLELPANKRATRLYKYSPYDYIVGDALIIKKNQIR